MEPYQEMRRKRQQLSEEEAIALLQQSTSGVLSLVDEEGYPYGVPLSYVYHDNKLYFHSALSGHKINAIRHSDKASFCIITQDEVHPETFTTHYRSVICFGSVRIIDDERQKLETLHLLGKRYNPDEQAVEDEIEKGFDRLLMIEFSIEHITGKEAGELAKGKTLPH